MTFYSLRSQRIAALGLFALCSIGANATVISTGTRGMAFALTSEGKLWGWGENWAASLGDGSNAMRYAPVLIGEDFAQVSAGDFFTTAVKRDGTLWFWGTTPSGDGIPDSMAFTRPTQIGTGYKQVAAGSLHFVALRDDGSIWSWGYNREGQLGINSTAIYSYNSVKVGDGFSKVVSGAYHTLALKTDGTLWVWGANSFGQLGIDTATTELRQPKLIGAGFADISAGTHTSAAIKLDGSLWTWGYNLCGELGDGTSDQRWAPKQVGSGFSQVALGFLHSAGIKADGSLWTWGCNSEGALANGSREYISVPKPTKVGDGYAQVAVSYGETHAVTRDGRILSWGRNAGDGTDQSRYSPTEIKLGQPLPFQVQFNASGELAAKTISADLQVASGDLSAIGDIFVGVTFPQLNNFTLLLTETGWQFYAAEAPFSRRSHQALAGTHLDILSTTNLTAIPGAELFVGYGVGDSSAQSYANMLKNKTMSVLSIK